MRQVGVYRNGIFAGVLIEENRKSYVFRYDDAYFLDPTQPAISLTMPKSKQEYRNDFIFPFFSNMIAEGVNLEIQSRYLKIDDRDVLGLLAATAGSNTIGAVTVKMIPS